MDLDPSIEPSIFVIVILVIVLVILYVFHIIKQKRENTINDCKCNINKQVENYEKNQISTPKNALDDKPKSNSNIFALYYSNGCGHSRDFLPEWNKLKDKINSQEVMKNLQSAEFECSKDQMECEKNKIRGVPSMILHKESGESVKYPDNKPRTMDSIIQFIKAELTY